MAALLRFVVNHESLRCLQEFHSALPDDACRAHLLRATSVMPHQLLSDRPMDKLAFMRFMDLAEQARAAGKLEAFADIVNKRSSGRTSPGAAASREQWTLARFEATSSPKGEEKSLRPWCDAVESDCAEAGIEAKLRAFMGSS
jgi:hypothetical protein